MVSESSRAPCNQGIGAVYLENRGASMVSYNIDIIFENKKEIGRL